ncbi:hypothetical protein ACFQ6N_24975 [Kitasatospora sp. NPDC056446]|uniref:hypothetical protein n=1 Tax=Kitasatospora sp. NPDC056446 TaxID=3345819 RepID=UPI00368D1A40
MVGEEQRGGPERRPAGLQLPLVEWALAGDGDAGKESGKGSGKGSASGESGAEAVAGAGAPTVVLPAQTGAGGAGGAGAVLGAGRSAVPPVAPPDPAGAAAVAGASSAAGVSEVLAAGVPAAEPGAEPGAEGGARSGRVSRPMIAAAVAVGLVLIGTSVVVTRLGGNDHKNGPARADAPPGYGQGGGDGGNGFVPGFDEHGGTSGGATPAPGAPAGAAVPPTDAGTGSPAPGDQPAAAGTGGKGSGAAAQPGGSANSAGSGGGSGSGTGQAAGGAGTAPGGSGGGANPAPQQPAPKQPVPDQPVPPPAGSQNPAPPPAKQPAPVTAIAGPYCGGYRTNGWYDDGDKGWRNNSGGYSGEGCNGTYASMPMSGDANDDKSNSVVWTFTLDKVTSCTLAVYIPASGNVKQVGGNPSYYTVQSGSGSVGSFSINQTASLGSWVTKGPFPYRGPISLTLHSRGVDWASGSSGAHHAAGAVRATCTA